MIETIVNNFSSYIEVPLNINTSTQSSYLNILCEITNFFPLPLNTDLEKLLIQIIGKININELRGGVDYSNYIMIIKKIKKDTNKVVEKLLENSFSHAYYIHDIDEISTLINNYPQHLDEYVMKENINLKELILKIIDEELYCNLDVSDEQELDDIEGSIRSIESTFEYDLRNFLEHIKDLRNDIPYDERYDESTDYYNNRAHNKIEEDLSNLFNTLRKS